MRVKRIHLENFKRFTDLTIEGIPETAKLVVLIGPNGCGKSSLFDSFKTWHLIKGYSNGVDNDYRWRFQRGFSERGAFACARGQTVPWPETVCFRRLQI